MKGIRSRRGALIASLAAGLVAASVLVANGTTARTASPTLVVDNSFTIKTSDPGRAFDPTASLVDHALYDTLFTYRGGDLTHPIPLLVSSYKVSANAKTYTFKLKRNVHFADGTPLTSADVAWSLRRLVNLKGNPSFLLAGITVSAPSKYTVVARSKTPATQLPVILANPSTGVLNSALVKKNGGSDAANAAKADKAENWLNSPASAGAGSGPYTLNAYSTTSQITLTPNTQYWGLKKSRWSSVVVRNMVAATAAAQRRPRLARDRGRPLGRPGADAQEQQERRGHASALDLDLLRLGQQRCEGLRGHVEQGLPEGGPVRARLRLAQEPRREGGDPGLGCHPVDVPRLASAECTRPDERREGQGGLERLGRR